MKKVKLKLNFIISCTQLQWLITKETHKRKDQTELLFILIEKDSHDRTKKVKAKDSGDWYDTGAPSPSLVKAKGVPIPNTQFSFGGDEEYGGDEVEGFLSSDFYGRGSPS